MKRLYLSLLMTLAWMPARAEIVMTDVNGATIKLAAPARRIVSLAPHITELLFAAGAGSHVVGNVEYGDYPPAARSLTKVGGYSRLDLEAIVALKPDLVMAWQSGNAPAAVSRLLAMGLNVHLSQSNRIEDIAGELERIGKLAGTEVTANSAATAFRERYARLAARYGQRPPVTVFYQIWKQPLMTINRDQIISDAIRLCGGRNVFAHLPILAPTVTLEAVIAANPEAIVASGIGRLTTGMARRLEALEHAGGSDRRQPLLHPAGPDTAPHTTHLGRCREALYPSGNSARQARYVDVAIKHNAPVNLQ